MAFTPLVQRLTLAEQRAGFNLTPTLWYDLRVYPCFDALALTWHFAVGDDAPHVFAARS